jgi:hypothetical protein
VRDCHQSVTVLQEYQQQLTQSEGGRKGKSSESQEILIPIEFENLSVCPFLGVTFSKLEAMRIGEFWTRPHEYEEGSGNYVALRGCH